MFLRTDELFKEARPSKRFEGQIRSLRTLGTITTRAWFALVGLSLDGPYGQAQELVFFATPSTLKSPNGVFAFKVFFIRKKITVSTLFSTAY